jgi:hypothetical protein
MNMVVTPVNVAAEVPRSVLIHAFAVLVVLIPTVIGVVLLCLLGRHPGECFRPWCHFGLGDDLELKNVPRLLRFEPVVLSAHHMPAIVDGSQSRGYCQPSNRQNNSLPEPGGDGKSGSPSLGHALGGWDAQNSRSCLAV